MADNKDENEKGGIVKTLFCSCRFSAVRRSLGIDVNFWWRAEPDPSAESEILDGNKPVENKKEEEEENSDEESEVEMECTENADGEECVPKKKVKKVNVEKNF